MTREERAPARRINQPPGLQFLSADLGFPTVTGKLKLLEGSVKANLRASFLRSFQEHGFEFLPVELPGRTDWAEDEVLFNKLIRSPAGAISRT